MPERKKTALISVWNKQCLEQLATALDTDDYRILSTGGTATTLREIGLEVVEISTYTGFPELFDGRVKTLHPKVLGGILARPEMDFEQMQTHDVHAIDLVVVNLYPFVETISRPNCTLEEAIENIDIGGITLMRAAAKNHAHVLIVVDPEDYDEVCTRITSDQVDNEYRRKMAAKAFRATTAYDAAIAEYLTSQQSFPERLTLTGNLQDVLRYGENPHQDAAFYRFVGKSGGTVSNRIQHQGKELSFNNIADTDAALACATSFKEPACAIVKHANPCGVAIGANIKTAYLKAFKCDPTSAFGGVIAFNNPLDGETMASILENQFAEVVVAPSVKDESVEIAKKRKQLRLLEVGSPDIDRTEFNVRTVSGGFLVQSADRLTPLQQPLNVVTQRTPNVTEITDLEFAWNVAQFVKSNAIVFCNDGATKGIGAGQMNRVLSVRIAHVRAQEEELLGDGLVMASDAFFPFRDGIDEAAKAGVTAVIQPGGSIRDDEVIAAANEHGMAMIFTGERHFKH